MGRGEVTKEQEEKLSSFSFKKSLSFHLPRLFNELFCFFILSIPICHQVTREGCLLVSPWMIFLFFPLWGHYWNITLKYAFETCYLFSFPQLFLYFLCFAFWANTDLLGKCEFGLKITRILFSWCVLDEYRRMSRSILCSQVSCVGEDWAGKMEAGILSADKY